jgi:hypothetical protein
VAAPLLRLSVDGNAGWEVCRVSNGPGFSCVRRGGVGFKMLAGYALVVDEQQVYGSVVSDA